ncbi:MAG: TlyA family RNA methyltransferase [Alphaproteobacteria bacterium]|nr:TlyA family RNA methyltransferase [Alphaproteobacteria bacterium]
MAKVRADQLVVERGLAETRTKAQALIIAGSVFTGEQRVDKPGQTMPDDTELELRGQALPYVSRGGLKLAHGLDHFDLDPAGMTAIDVGASTGGFTDVLLQRGAVSVYAVDVGHGQLDWRLRNDPRVAVLEKTNARYLTSNEIGDPIDLVVCDASFISLRTVLPASLALVKAGGWLVALIKPQFEVGKGEVGKGGVIRDEALHRRVCDEIETWLSKDCGWTVLGITPSPVLGPKGNREFLIAARRFSAISPT